MTIAYLAANKLTGLSGDSKPTAVPVNSIFIETDTLLRFLFDGAVWNAFPHGGDGNKLLDYEIEATAWTWSSKDVALTIPATAVTFASTDVALTIPATAYDWSDKRVALTIPATGWAWA